MRRAFPLRRRGRKFLEGKLQGGTQRRKSGEESNVGTLAQMEKRGSGGHQSQKEKWGEKRGGEGRVCRNHRKFGPGISLGRGLPAIGGRQENEPKSNVFLVPGWAPSGGTGEERRKEGSKDTKEECKLEIFLLFWKGNYHPRGVEGAWGEEPKDLECHVPNH